METLCGLFGVSRQAWYEKQKRHQKADLKSAIVLAEVRRLRLDLPSVGAEILHHQLADFRERHGIKLGRDKFAKLLRDNGLLIRRRTRRARTTWSNHPFRKYPNLVKGKKVDAPNTLWVSDITYLPLPRGFAYLSLITDAYSRKIVGWTLHPTLEMEGPLSALKMALKANKTRQHLIHHSDRGVQYCCHAYTGLLRKNKIAISMTEQGDPYENALAERVNRTIKEDMLLNRGFISYAAAEEGVQRAIENYNRLRPHRSCGYYTPEQAHRMQGELVKKWRVTKRRQAAKMPLAESMSATQK
ncbi:transposase InsO family protein [Spirosoma sp. LMG 31448]|uniref:Transposase InsO family protein n=2 Tax=Spirosoma utsteinense TaxID=2585773 RepID=A0ABR6WF69_9BACT|nr:transposase InsO family protein [Spirosoma utsteinense]MBC3795159.1 transposase InsO family protein [Spirosoma utsteinense]